MEGKEFLVKDDEKEVGSVVMEASKEVLTGRSVLVFLFSVVVLLQQL